MISRFFVLACILLFTFSTSCNKQVHENVESPLVDFANDQIQKSIQGQKEIPVISWILDSINVSKQSYAIEVKDENILITGGDENGLMYGGLDVAEQFRLYGKVQNSTQSPYILNRGLKMNIPLDARTPSYDDSGDSAIKNVETVWDWNFWTNYLDEMALNRYNVLSLWNPHPFPSLIKLKEYPDIALNDVYTTNYKPTGLENEMGDPQLVSKVVFENLKLVKQISIDEKIAFWQRVMAYAKNRGIAIYWITWNICPNSVATPVDDFYKTYGINVNEEVPGKHGITHQMDNPITIDYHRKAVNEFLKTYPNIKGIGTTAGEHMPLEWDGINREEWLWMTYGLGISDFKKEHPNRPIDFIHRVWHSDMDQIMKYWSNYEDTFDVSFKYAKARLYSSPTMNFHEEHVTNMANYNLKSWWNLRNDDIFVYRWANVDYVRRFLSNLPIDETKGFMMGSDGYVWAKEYISKHQELSGEYEFIKHKLRFLLWGRLGYDNSLSENRILNIFEEIYPSEANEQLFKTWQNVSKIIPIVNSFHWRDWDAQWSVEASRARPKLGGYRTVKDFVDNPVMANQNLINCSDYAESVLNNNNVTEKTPLDILKELVSIASTSLSEIELLETPKNVHTRALIEDIKAQSYLGLFYAHKIDASLQLAFWNKTKAPDYKNKSIESMSLSLRAVENYAKISNANYYPQMLARPGNLDWDELVENVKADLSFLKEL